MTPSHASILYTQDPDLSRRIKVYLRSFSQVRHVTEPQRLEPVLHQAGSAILIMDLRAREAAIFSSWCKANGPMY